MATTTTEAEIEGDETEVSTTTMGESAEEAEETTRPSERLQQKRCQCVYGHRVFTTTTAALAE